jgi:hypothetical protein
VGSGNKTVTTSAVTVGDGVNNANYSVNYANNTTSTITTAPVIVTAQNDSRAYNGTVASLLAPTVSGTLYDAVGTAASQVFDNKNAGTGKTLTASGMVMNDGNGGANYAISYVPDTTGSISQANLTLSTANVSKTYDGGLSAAGHAVVNAGTLFAGDTLTGGSFAFTDKNVGSGNKTVTTSGVTMNDGNSGANYVVNYANNTASTINVRPLSNWTGNANSSLWSAAANWDALPDGFNVLAVSIPNGASVVYDSAAGATHLQSITSAGAFAMAGGNLTIASNLFTPQYSQTGGVLSGAGSLSVTNRFSQTGGSLELGGKITIAQSTGNLTLNVSNATAVQLSAASGNIELTNVGAIDIEGISASNGDITVNNTGGINTTAAITAPNGAVSLTAHSPITIGSGGISSSGNIMLLTATPDATSNLTLNGSLTSSAGGISLNAANNFVQNGLVMAALGVTANAGGRMTFGTSAHTVGNPVNYTANGSAVSSPGGLIQPTPTSEALPEQVAAAVVADLVVTFSSKFEEAMIAQESASGDPLKPKKKVKDAVVVEGEICSR